MPKTPKKNIITLVGLMGVGKSETAKELAQIAGYEVVDSDHEIEKDTQKTITKIFQENGEQFFRNKEKETIREIVINKDKIVIATGGGAFCDKSSADLLLENSFVVWLKCDIETITKRLEEDNSRPILKENNKEEILKSLAKKREIFYQRAHFSIDTTSKTPIEIASKIWQKIFKQ